MLLLLLVVVLLLLCFNSGGRGSVVVDGAGAGAGAFCGVTTTRATSSTFASSSQKGQNNNNDNNDNLQILYQNKYMAVINKPPLVPCHQYYDFQQQSNKKKKKKKSYHQNQQNDNDNHNGNDNDNVIVPTTTTTTTIIQRAYNTFPLQSKIYLVHRLDVQTSGCLIIAFSSKVANILSQALSSSTSSHKTYYAICRGNGQSLRQLCCCSHGSNGNGNYFMADGDVKDSKGIKRNATTKIWGLMGSDNIIDNVKARRCCLVKCQPLTGRYHQIRQHLGRLNYPIVGETRHHPDRTENKGWKSILVDNNNNNNDNNNNPTKLRLCLHCHRIQLLSNITTTTTTMLVSSEDNKNGNSNSSNNNNFNNNVTDLVHNNNNINLKSILPPDGILDVSCPLPNDMKHIIDMTDWGQKARDAYPELF